MIDTSRHTPSLRTCPPGCCPGTASTSEFCGYTASAPVPPQGLCSCCSLCLFLFYGNGTFSVKTSLTALFKNTTSLTTVFKTEHSQGWGCSSGAEHLPSRCKALGSRPALQKMNERKKTKQNSTPSGRNPHLLRSLMYPQHRIWHKLDTQIFVEGRIQLLPLCCGLGKHTGKGTVPYNAI